MIRRTHLMSALFFMASILPAGIERGLAADEIEIERDVEYSNPKDQHLKLTLARPAKIEGLAPAVIFIHGGGWAVGHRDRWQGACEELARRGFVAVTVTYRFAPAFPFPAAVEDVQAGVRWLRANAERLNIDPNRIGAAGDSAGGHLAQCLGVGLEVQPSEPSAEREHASGTADQSSRVQCLVNIYGPNDMTREHGVNPQVDELLRNFLGGDVKQARRQYILASPFFWVTPEAAPTLIIHGTKDNVVAFEQATIMQERLKAADVEVEVLALEGAGHGFQGADAQKSDAAMYAWLEAHLKPKK
jgi:acetyl esterase/lipase